MSINIRTQAPTLYIPELNRLIEEIRTKPLEDKELAASELKVVYMKYSEYSEQVSSFYSNIPCSNSSLKIFRILLRLINSNDTQNEKLGPPQ